MKFLVQIEVKLPSDFPNNELQELVEAEAKRARELIAAGLLEQIWRIPGRTANIGIWEAPDATVLHNALTSLPMWRWIDAQVTALAVHPNSP